GDIIATVPAHDGEPKCKHRVRTFSDDCIFVDVIPIPEPAPPPPPVVRKLVNEEDGDDLGTHTGEVTVFQVLDTTNGNLRVERVTAKAIFVSYHTTAEVPA